MNAFSLFRFFSSVPLFMKIDQEMTLWECRQTDACRNYVTICPMLCHSYGTGNHFIKVQYSDSLASASQKPTKKQTIHRRLLRMHNLCVDSTWMLTRIIHHSSCCYWSLKTSSRRHLNDPLRRAVYWIPKQQTVQSVTWSASCSVLQHSAAMSMKTAQHSPAECLQQFKQCINDQSLGHHKRYMT